MNIIRHIDSSNQMAAQDTIREFDRAYEVSRPDIEEGEKQWRRYFPINYGKWDPKAVKILEEEMRQPVQIDISSPRIDTLAGSIFSDLPDPSWIPTQGERNLLTEAISLKYYSDKDLSNYDDVFLKVLRDGLLHAGDLVLSEAWIDGVPFIKAERVLHGFVIWDPEWITDDDREAEVYFRIGYFNPVKLKNKYGATTPELESAIEEWLRDKSRFSDNQSEEARIYNQGRVGNQLQVIEKHFVEEIHVKRLVGRRVDDNYYIPFPIGKGQEYLEKFAEVNNIDWESVVETPYDDKIEYVTTVVRDLRMCVQEKVKSKIQVKGLSAHHFTARRWMNRNMGIMASIGDIEDIINKRESMINDQIGKAGGGASLINEKLFPDDAQWKKWIKNKNRSSYEQRVPLDDIVKNAIIKDTPDMNLNYTVNQIERMYTQVLPLVSRVSEAMTSMSSSNEPGVLFERKFQTNLIANTILNQNIKQFLNNFAESYFYQYSITYSDVPFMKVPERGGDKTAIVLNQKFGSQTINWVGDTPRCRVVMAENKKSSTYKMRWRSIWSEMMQSLSQSVQATGGITIPYLLLSIKNFFGTIDIIKEEDQGMVKVIDELTMMIARLKLVVEASASQTKLAQDSLVNAQIDMQLQQIWQQLQATQTQQQQPVSHMENVPSSNINYPQDQINPPQAEAATMGATPPAMTGAPV